MDETPTPLGYGLFCLAMVGTFLIMIPISFVLERWRLRRVTVRFLHGRVALPDSAYLLRVSATPEDETFFLAARRSMATLCGVPPEMIHPEDTWRTLMDLQFDNGYMDDIVFLLERELGRPLPLAYPEDVRLSFSDYVRQLAACLARADRARNNHNEPQWPLTW
jgi:hypothetical protein